MHAARHCDGICKLYGACDSRVCIVMKRYDKSLQKVIEEKERLEESEVRRHAHSLFRILGQMHESGMVVRDIKPDNILVDLNGDLVLSDFGISEVMQSASHIVQTQIKGTFTYMGPEVFTAQQVGPPPDIWAMACAVLEMYTGVPPWRDMQMQQIMYAVCMEQRVPQVPAEAPAADVLRKCFALAPAARPTELGWAERRLARPHGPRGRASLRSQL